ncbi:hypothetical protein HN681_04145 [archaeon]|jgi:hypothetical protein|nr:hypothetical protein [archaeon]MBT3731427.1 hypothetical protein [archaeon]MBT4670270.1 hypothetical protein [archaeon]MBT5029712.1 hypothetical protein [archaeon]MBT5287539.1 hypothetical protein [archaeon]
MGLEDLTGYGTIDSFVYSPRSNNLYRQSNEPYQRINSDMLYDFSSSGYGGGSVYG